MADDHRLYQVAAVPFSVFSIFILELLVFLYDFIYLCYYFVFSNIHFFLYHEILMLSLFSLVWRGESCVLEVYVENLNVLKKLYVIFSLVLCVIYFICCMFATFS